MSRAPKETAHRIVEAALRILARQGATNFSMAGIAREAGISRRTVYRYFSNDRDVLQAVATHVGDTYVQAIDDAIAEHPGLDERIEVVLSATVNYGDYHPAAVAVFRMEPAFTFQFIQSTLPHYIEVVRKAIEPVTQKMPAVRSGAVTDEEIAEIIMRLGVSGFSLDSEGTKTLARAFARIIQT